MDTEERRYGMAGKQGNFFVRVGSDAIRRAAQLGLDVGNGVELTEVRCRTSEWQELRAKLCDLEGYVGGNEEVKG
jgi:hypothetical protein